MIFLSVEGKKTEPHYFEGLNRELSRGQLPFPRRVIKVLKKEDHNSDPGSVIALLEEYLALRHERYDHVFPPVFLKKYEHSTIRRYFQGMYFVDVSQEYDMRELFENRPVSRNHSFVSGELSRISRTNKRVNFEQYADKLFDAIERSRQMGEDIYSLMGQPGSNLCLLFDIIEGKRESMWFEDASGQTASTKEEWF